MVIVEIVVFALILLLLIIYIELLYNKFHRAAPMVPSSLKLRKAVIYEINANYKNLQTVLDIGGGYGGLARKISRECLDKSVTSVEKMPTAAWFSKIADNILRSRSRTVHDDMFGYIDRSDGFDIGVAYLLTPMMPQLAEFLDKFKVLLVLDFPLPNVQPSRKIKLHQDMTQHWLYVYE